MFKVSQKVPEIYMKESRDFQLFPRLDDLLFLGEHFEANTLLELNNPKKCKNTYLKYLAEKVGFYTDKYIPDKVLINIISAFRVAVKNKGTQLGIEQAVNAILKAENSIEPLKLVHVKGFNETNTYYEQYTINIYTPIKIINEIALKEFLKYIIPAGYNYNLYVYEDAKIGNEIITINPVETVGILKTNMSGSATLGSIRTKLNYNDENENSKATINNLSNINIKDNDNRVLEDRLLGAFDMGVVVDKNAIDNNNIVKYEDVNITVHK